MKIFTTLLFTLACLVHPAFAQDAVQTTGDYETPGPVRAEDFLPKSAFAGKRLFVQKTAQNNGLQNIYRIRAGAEEYEVPLHAHKIS